MPSTWKQDIQSALKSSVSVLTGIMITNILNYLFTLILARHTSPENYGTIAALLSLTIILNPVVIAASNFFAKYTTIYQAQHDYAHLNRLVASATQASILLGLGTIGLWWLLDTIVAPLLHISAHYIFIFACVIGLTFPRSIHLAILQGLQKFTAYATLLILESSIKIGVILLFIQQNVTVSQAILATLASAIGTNLILFITLNRILKNNQPIQNSGAQLPWHIKTMYRKAKPWFIHVRMLFLIGLATNALMDIDTILAKHYGDATTAGQYAALMTISRIIFYTSVPFGFVLFPAMVKAKALQKGQEKKIFLRGFAIIISIATLIAILFTYSPYHTLTLFFGERYIGIAPYIRLTNITTLAWAITSTFIGYFITTEKYRFSYALLAIAFLQLIFLHLFHQDIMQIISVFTVSSLLAATTALGFFMQGNRENTSA